MNFVKRVILGTPPVNDDDDDSDDVEPIKVQVKQLMVRKETEEVRINEYDAEIRRLKKLNRKKQAMQILKKKKLAETRRNTLESQKLQLESLQNKQVDAQDTLIQVDLVSQVSKNIAETLKDIDIEEIGETKAELDNTVSEMDEINNILNEGFGDETDYDELEREWEKYNEDDTSIEMPTVPEKRIAEKNKNKQEEWS